MSGYNPASTTSNALPQSTVTFYDRKFVENLKIWTLFLRCSERRPLPMNSGNKLELFMYQPLPANITQISEGTVGSGITPTVLTNTTTIGFRPLADVKPSLIDSNAAMPTRANLRDAERLSDWASKEDAIVRTYGNWNRMKSAEMTDSCHLAA